MRWKAEEGMEKVWKEKRSAMTMARRWRQSSARRLVALSAAAAVNHAHAPTFAISRLVLQSRHTSLHLRCAARDRLLAPAIISLNKNTYTAGLKFRIRKHRNHQWLFLLISWPMQQQTFRTLQRSELARQRCSLCLHTSQKNWSTTSIQNLKKK